MWQLVWFHRILLLALALSNHLCASAKQFPIADKSETGSPLAVSGVLMFNDDGVEATNYSLEFHETVRNVSKKPIVLFIVAAKSVDDDKHPLYNYSNDYFFSTQLLDPGQTEEASISGPRYAPRADERPEPSFSPGAEVVYVQFSDGTQWGDLESADDVQRIRKLTLAKLESLRTMYESGGDTVFATELTKPEKWYLPVLSTLRNLYEQSGIDEAEIVAWNMLEAAKSRRSALFPSPRRRPD